MADEKKVDEKAEVSDLKSFKVTEGFGHYRVGDVVDFNDADAKAAKGKITPYDNKKAAASKK